MAGSPSAGEAAARRTPHAHSARRSPGHACRNGPIYSRSTMGTDVLFRPFSIKQLTLPNRIVMAPMTRSQSPGGVPGENVAAYYRRRAEAGVGLIMTEGTWVPHPSAGFNPRVPRFYGEDALAGWKRVADEVHAAGGRLFPQLWHVGAWVMPHETLPPEMTPLGPSGVGKDGPAPGR